MTDVSENTVLGHKRHVMASPRLQPLFWDSWFVGSAAVDWTMRLINELCSGPYFDRLTQYGVNNRPTVLEPIVFLNQDPPPDSSFGPGDIATLLRTWIDAGVVPAPAAKETDLLYLIFCSANASVVASDASAYHTWDHYPWSLIESGDANLFYAVFPFPSSGRSATDPIAFAQEMAKGVAHECAEVFTDRDGSGWTDSNPDQTLNEIGDPCASVGGTWGPWNVQPYWSDIDGGCAYGPILTPSCITWTAAFWGTTQGVGPDQLLVFRPDDGYWFIIFTDEAGYWRMRYIDNTTPSFGALGDGRPLFRCQTSDGTQQIAFQKPTGTWWLTAPGTDPTVWRSLQGGGMPFVRIKTTATVDGLFFPGQFSVAQPQVACYDRPTGEWQILQFGASSVHGATALGGAGNTGAPGSGMGDLTGYPWWNGTFIPQVWGTALLFYAPQDGDWICGYFDESALQFTWTRAANTMGSRPGDPNFGQVWDGRPFLQGQFNSVGQDELLFFHGGGDGEWWRATMTGFGGAPAMTWTFAGSCNSDSFDFTDMSTHLFWSGRFLGTELDQVLVYRMTDGNWFLGYFDYGGGAQTLTWYNAGNTGAPGSGFGDLLGCRFWVGRFVQADRESILCYSAASLNMVVGTFDVTNQLVWSEAQTLQFLQV